MKTLSSVRLTMLVAASISVALLSGCSAMQQQAQETKGRGTIETGGYTWSIISDSEGGNAINTHGLPSRQYANEASTILCKKYGRISQFSKQYSVILLGIQQYDFNCVR